MPLSINGSHLIGNDPAACVELNIKLVNDNSISVQVRDALMLVLDTALLFPPQKFDARHIEFYKKLLDQISLGDL